MTQTCFTFLHSNWGRSLRWIGLALVGIVFGAWPWNLKAGTDVWTGSGPLGGRVTALVVDPSDHNVVLAGVFSVGVLKSTDSGTSWNPMNSGVTNLDVVSLVMDPKDHKILYAGSKGLFKSKDGGNTWSPTGLGEYVANAIAIHPNDSNTLYVGTAGQGILKSVTGGTTFFSVTNGLTNNLVLALAIDPVEPNILFAGTQVGGSRFFRSTDGGASWTANPQVFYDVNSLVVDAVDHRTVYAGTQGGLLKSLDQGENWGWVWSLTSGVYSLRIDPIDHHVLYAATDQGAYRTENGGGYWSPWNEGLAELFLTSLALDPADHNTVYAGTFSKGVFSITFTRELPPSLKITAPNGNEKWPAGSAQSITWTYTGNLTDANIELSTDGGASYNPIVSLIAATTGSYSLTVPGVVSSQCLVRISEIRELVSDVSDASFTITPALPSPSFSFKSPLEGSIVNGDMVNLQVVSSEGSQVQDVVFYIDDNFNQSSFPRNDVWNTNLYSNGLHRIQAFINALNGQFKLQISVTVNNPSPVASRSLFLLSSARAGGLGGAFYTTDVTVANNGLLDANFTLKFLGHDIDGTQGPERSFLLPAGKTMTFSDVLKSVFGLESGYGAIRMFSSDSDLTMQGQTSTPGVGGTFGQSVPSGNALEDGIASGGYAFISPIREDSSFRTNLILCNLDTQPTDVQVTLVSDRGESLGSQHYNLPALGMTQVRRVVRSLGVQSEVRGARLVLSTQPEGLFAAYASVIDNITNDPRTLLPEIRDFAWLLPSAARASGAGGAFYTTDLSLFNSGVVDASLTLQFLGHDSDGRNGPYRRLTLAPGTSVIYADALKSLFGLESGYGAIRIASASGLIIMQSQTSTPGAGGTFGQSVPPSRYLVSNGIPRFISAIREDSSFRTNLILANPYESVVDADLTLISSEGETLGTKRVTLPPLGMTQITRVVRAVGVTTEIRGARLLLSTPTPNGFIAAYASTIDNLTNDPRTLLPR